MGLFSSKVKSLSYWIMWFWQCVCLSSRVCRWMSLKRVIS